MLILHDSSTSLCSPLRRLACDEEGATSYQCGDEHDDESAAHDPAMLRVWTALMQIGNFVAGVLVTPILTIASSIFYFDLRVRKEAFDLQLMMNPLGGGVPAPRSATTLLS